MHEMKPRWDFVRHPKDQGVDEIMLCSELPKSVADSRRTAFLKIGLIERYKTSWMSGDEWRFSTGLYLREQPGDEWELISTGGGLQPHCAQLYPELYGDLVSGKRPEEFYQREVGAVAFSWKGYPVYSVSYDGESRPLLIAAGHVPWAWYLASGQGSDPSPLQDLCCQPGCAEPHVSVYKKKQDFCRPCGHPREYYQTVIDSRPQVRGFCAKHLRRGDCGLDDADLNYEVLSGRGPGAGREPDPAVVKPAKFVGTVRTRSEKPDEGTQRR